MKEIRNKGPFIFAPRDKNGNKMVWDENKKDYVEDSVIYAKPLAFAPRDRNGKAMIWDDEEKIYKSEETGQKFSTVVMKFVEEEPEISVETMGEFEEPLNSLDSDDIVFDGIDELIESEDENFDEDLDLDDFESYGGKNDFGLHPNDPAFDEDLEREEEIMMIHRGQLASGYADGDFFNDFGSFI